MRTSPTRSGLMTVAAWNPGGPAACGAGIDAVALNVDIGGADAGQLRVIRIIDQIAAERFSPAVCEPD